MIYVVLRDGGHGVDTRGKRTPFVESLGRSIKETEFNEPVSALFGEELERHGVIVHDISEGLEDVPLVVRTNIANNYLNAYIRKYGSGNVKVVLVSVHFNAFDGSFEGADPSGISVHIQPGSNHARKLAECVGKHLRQGTKQVWRGIIEQNLHITREFEGVGILTENGFMDNEREAALMLDREFQQEVATETAKGVLEYFGLSYVPRVQVKAAAAIEKEEGGSKMIKVTSPALDQAITAVLWRMEEEGSLTAKWRQAHLNGNLSVDDALGLLFVAVERGFIHNNYSNPKEK